MSSGYKKLIIILVIAVGITIFFLMRQISLFNKISVEKSERPLIEQNSVMIPLDTGDPLLGNQGAPITLVEFVDLNSQQNRMIHSKIAKFVEDNPTELRLIFKDFPNQGFFSSNTNEPHYAAYCVQKQDRKKFWQYLNELSKYPDEINKDKILMAAAENIKINSTTLKICLDSTEAKTRVESSASLAESLGLEKSPALFVNNRLVNYVTEINIDDLLAELIKKY